MDNWKPWLEPSEYDKIMQDRALSNLPEMESAKQLVEIIQHEYLPGMRVLDVGCNVGHYLRSLRNYNQELRYVGIDFVERYISKAKEIFQEDKFASFEKKDVFEPIFPSQKFDIVFSCNVLLHLPEFKTPLKNILDSTKKVCIIRTLLGEKTTMVKSVENNEFDEDGNPLEYIYLNTWNLEYFTNYIKKMNFDAEVIEDKFNSEAIQRDYEKEHNGKGTKMSFGKQVDSNIIMNWKWIKATRKN